MIDLKNWAKTLSGSATATTVLSSPSAAVCLPAPTSHPLRVPAVPSLSVSNGIPGKSKADYPVSNNGMSPLGVKGIVLAML